jgi:hypothetical protein
VNKENYILGITCLFGNCTNSGGSEGSSSREGETGRGHAGSQRGESQYDTDFRVSIFSRFSRF